MNKILLICSLTPLLINGQMKLKHSETIERTFAAPKTVGVDNIFGSVHVIGYNGQQVQLSAIQTNEADTQELLDKAAKEVTLKSEMKDGELQIYPDGPFRESHSPFERRHDHEPGYRFKFEITVKVPSAMSLDLRTVQGGIVVDDVRGHFDVHAVNGGIEMKDVGGEGDVRSVNGPLHVSFSQNPTGPCTFKTVNGAIDVSLRQGLSADLQYKTLHGGIYTDFELTGLPTAVAGSTERQNGRFVYRSRGYSSSRVGAGGPLLTFETINGEIDIRKK